jgi:hypothetical protein
MLRTVPRLCHGFGSQIDGDCETINGHKTSGSLGRGVMAREIYHKKRQFGAAPAPHGRILRMTAKPAAQAKAVPVRPLLPAN